MRILCFILLILPFCAYAQEDFTFDLSPQVKGLGRFYFSGPQGETVTTDAEAQVQASFDYKHVAGAHIELQGLLQNAREDAASLGFGDNAYAYIHALKVFGIEKNILDLYLKAGRFELELQNAQSATQRDDDDDRKADVSPLSGRINMQLDFKLLDMLTLRYGLGFYASKPIGEHDMGWGLLLDKTFGVHRIQASLAYTLSLLGLENLADHDQLGVSVAYTLMPIRLTPYFNLRLKNLLQTPDAHYRYAFVHWNAGLQFALQNDILKLGIDFDGEGRRNQDAQVLPYFIRQAATGPEGFTGMEMLAASNISVIGLSFWGKVRLEFWENDLERQSILHSWSLGLEQYLVNQANAKVKLVAEFGMQDLGLFDGYYSYQDGRFTQVEDRFQTYLELGIEAELHKRF